MTYNKYENERYEEFVKGVLDGIVAAIIVTTIISVLSLLFGWI